MVRTVQLLILLNLVTLISAAQESAALLSRLEAQRESLLVDKEFVWGVNAGIMFAMGPYDMNELRFFVSGGIARGIAISDDPAPFLAQYHIQLEAFRGGVGSSLLERGKFNFEVRNAFIMHYGKYKARNAPHGRMLLQSVGANQSAIRNPYETSVGLGTMFVNGLNHDRHQQLGHITVGYRKFELSYLNDGPPFHWLALGDGHDRYWTGMGFASLYFLEADVTRYTLQYQRYTGWQRNLYEMENQLDLDYMAYKDFEEIYLNQGVWTFGAELYNAFQLYGKIYETNNSDVQRIIHSTGDLPFHPNLLGRRYTLGAGYIYER